MSLANLSINNQAITDLPEIYVASLSDYNAGVLHGCWINAGLESDDIHDQIQAMLKESKQEIAEEFAIHDYQGFFNINIHEYETVETVSKIASGISEHGEAFAAYAYMMDDLENIDFENFMDMFQGEYDSEMEFAVEMFEMCYQIPEQLEYYIDYEKFCRDLFLSDYTSFRSSQYTYYIFRNE